MESRHPIDIPPEVRILAQRKGADVDEDALPIEVSADTRRLSRRPASIRQRIRRNGGRVSEDIVMLWEAQHGNAKPVSEWTLEELQHGRPRHPEHGWRGVRPKWITPIIQAEVRKRLREETIGKLIGHTGAAIKVLAEFLGNDEEPHLRFKAASLIIEYAAGAPDKNVIVTGNVQLQNMLAGALVLDDGSPAHPVIDGTAQWSDEPEDDDDDDE
jgi:hypothetical protein